MVSQRERKEAEERQERQEREGESSEGRRAVVSEERKEEFSSERPVPGC